MHAGEMPLLTHNQETFWVTDWEVRPSACEIAREDSVIRLEPKVMDLLVLLASRPGSVFSRAELEENVWRGTVVGYDALSKAIGKLREAFGDSGKPARLVQTVPKKGYRLVATVRYTPLPAQGVPDTSPGPIPRLTIGVAIALTLACVVALIIVFNPFTRVRTPPGISTQEAGAQQNREKPAIVVMPFRSLVEGQNNEYLADGLTSDVITDLSRLENLTVVAASSVQKFKEITYSNEEVARTFNIRYMVTGDLARKNDFLRINVRLLDARAGSVLWARRYERKVTDLFTVQGEMVKNIVTALSVRLSDEELQRVSKAYTDNLEAYALFVQGQKLSYPGIYEDNLIARDFFRRAIELDPHFARAYSGLALTYAAEYRYQWKSDAKDPLRRARELADIARVYDPDLPNVYWVLGLISVYEKKTQEAVDHLNYAIRINPNYADAYALLGVAHIWEDKLDQAVKYLRYSLRLDPAGSFLHYRMLGLSYYYLGDYDQSLISLKQAYQRNPTNIDTLLFLACAYLNLGQIEEARWMLTEASLIRPDFNPAQVLQTVPFQDEGKRHRILRDLEKLMQQRE